MITRSQAQEILFDMTKSDSLRRHARTVEIVEALQPHQEKLGL